MESLPYFQVIADFSLILKLLYENLQLEEQVLPGEPLELSSLKSMITYIEEHFMERITLKEISAAGACCISRCLSLMQASQKLLMNMVFAGQAIIVKPFKNIMGYLH